MINSVILIAALFLHLLLDAYIMHLNALAHDSSVISMPIFKTYRRCRGVKTMIKHQDYRKLPLVYSCSGCSSAAQAANYIALKLDHEGVAEMSCISGVGGNVPHLVNIARSGRPILALDGCPLACALHCLSERGIAADYHLQLQERGVEKRYHADFDREEADRVAVEVAEHARQLRNNRPAL